MRVLLFIGLISTIVFMNAQSSATRERVVNKFVDSLRIDSLSIVPGSMNLLYDQGESVPEALYDIDYSSAWIYWKDQKPSSPIIIRYRTFPYMFDRTFKNKEYQRLDLKPVLFMPDGGPIYNANEWGDYNKIKFDGSIARELSFGNSQNVVLNSRMNLQLSGALTEDLELIASITDENIPFQPGGNTAEIRDFDRVYIELKGSRMGMRAGDLEIKNRDSYFMRYFKNTKGILYTTRRKDLSGDISAQASFSIAQGKYQKQYFNGEEGNQGPYKLFGKNGESYIVILAGSERVFIDGIAMKRGEQNDYTIDYNTGELSFTSNRLITKDHRVMIEFEYSDQNYFRSLKTFGAIWNNEKWDMKFDLYSQTDHKNQSVQQNLSLQEKQLLAQVGDSISNAYSLQFDSLAYENGKVRYALIDTSYGGQYYDSVFVYSNDASNAHYELSFIYVGEGNGFYNLSDTNINGRVYEWVAPLNGAFQGAYAPVKILVSPKSINMIHLSSKYKINQNGQFGLEFAASQRDINTFSDLHNADDNGVAAKLYYEQAYKLNSDTIKSNIWNLKHRLSSEWVSSNFNQLERFRSVEFNRDWNISGLESNGDLINNYHLGITRGKKVALSYDIIQYDKAEDFKGLKQALNASINGRDFKLISRNSYLDAKLATHDNQFFRPYFELKRSFDKLSGISVGTKYEQEKNLWRVKNTDSLDVNSFEFRKYDVFITNPDSMKHQWNLTYALREDYRPNLGFLELSSKSNNLGISNQLWSQNKNRLNLRLNYRTLDIGSNNLENLDEDNNLNGRFEYYMYLLKGALSGQSLYELGRGLEQQKEYMYLEVPAGEGLYTWIDDGDGVQQLGEFELSNFQDQANFIKVYTVTSEYQKVYTLAFNQSLNFNMKRLWVKQKGIKGFLSKFSDQLNAQINRKTIQGGDMDYFNPFYESYIADELVSINSMLRNVFFFNRANAKYSIEWHLIKNRQKSFLINGFEERAKEENKIKARINWNKNYKSRLTITESYQKTASDWMQLKNYNIKIREVEKSLEWIAMRKSRLSINLRLSEKENILSGASEKATIQDISLDWSYNLIKKSALSTRISLLKVNYTGSTNTSLNYIMLEALQDGNNMLWQLGWNRKISSNMQMRFTYDGRWADDSKTVHVGRAHVRYNF